ncbi:MAG: TadE/TadG family type IV pilus assembly protein [Pirellulaceae bacterium]
MMAMNLENRQGVATVEVAVCLPIFVSIVFGFISLGLAVQLKSNSKLIGHMAATEIFRAKNADASTNAEIESKYLKLANDLGLRGFSLGIHRDSAGTFEVSTEVSFAENYSFVPLSVSPKKITTKTFVFVD